MKVSELIKALQYCDPEAWVIAHEEGNPYIPNVLVKCDHRGNSFNIHLNEDLVHVVYLDFDPKIKSLVENKKEKV